MSNGKSDERPNPYNVAPYEPHIYRQYNEHPAVAGDPSKQKKPGWEAGYPQPYVLANPGLGVYLTHVVRMGPDDKTPLYDHYMRLERGGGVFLPFDQEGKIGLLPVPRPTTRDQAAWAEAFDKRLFLYSSCGKISWEVPRGMGKKGESGKDTAKREGSEELQGSVTQEFDGGWMVDNTTFCPHQTKLTLGMVDLSKAPLAKDKLEADIGKAKFFSLDAIWAMEESGEVYDSYTLSAIHRFEQMLKRGKLPIWR